MSEWKLVDVEGIGSGYACLTLDGVSTTKSRNLIQADRGAGGDGLGFSDLGTLLIDYADRDIAGVVGITGDQGGIREDVVGRSDVHIISGVEFCSARPIDTRGDTFSRCDLLRKTRGSAQKHFHTDATTGRRCESAFALLSHKKVTKRLWTAASYGKIGVVGYRLLQERDG